MNKLDANRKDEDEEKSDVGLHGDGFVLMVHLPLG